MQAQTRSEKRASGGILSTPSLKSSLGIGSASHQQSKLSA